MKIITAAGQPMSPAEVGLVFGVSAHTIASWTTRGLFPDGSWFRTPAGQRRYHRAAIEKLLNGDGDQPMAVIR